MTQTATAGTTSRPSSSAGRWTAARAPGRTHEVGQRVAERARHAPDLTQYWRDAFEDIRWDPEEILDFGDRFLVTTQQTGRGSGSGVAVSEPVFQLFEIRRGLVVRQEDFLDRSKALEAAGLAELREPTRRRTSRGPQLGFRGRYSSRPCDRRSPPTPRREQRRAVEQPVVGHRRLESPRGGDVGPVDRPVRERVCAQARSVSHVGGDAGFDATCRATLLSVRAGEAGVSAVRWSSGDAISMRLPTIAHEARCLSVGAGTQATCTHTRPRGETPPSESSKIGQTSTFNGPLWIRARWKSPVRRPDHNGPVLVGGWPPPG
jgi:hypothetical protein